jgi:hypothetical protein
MSRTRPLRRQPGRARARVDRNRRVAACRAVVDRYDHHFQLSLTEAEKHDLTQFLRSLYEGAS